MCGNGKRLPNFFTVVRDILKTLVLNQDQAKITERLDVDLVIQQIYKGICDVVDLANWLRELLKKYCAPLRDGLVDKMYDEVTNGAQQADQKLMVSGLRQLLNLLEAMKLDLANYQIDCMRPQLVAGTVNFMKQYIHHRIGLGKLNPEISRLWLEHEYNILSAIKGTPMSYLETLIHALLRKLLFCSSTISLTPTFYLDLDHLRTIKVDMHHAICHQVCSNILVDLLSRTASRLELPEALSVLGSSIPAIVGSRGSWVESVENIAVELVRTSLTLEGRVHPYDADLISEVERRLQEDLDLNSSVFYEHAQDMFDRFLPKTKECVNAHCRMPTIELQEALVPPMPAEPAHSFGMCAICEPAAVARREDSDMEIVRRFSHVVVLHWQVWADLVYLVGPRPEPGLAKM